MDQLQSGQKWAVASLTVKEIADGKHKQAWRDHFLDFKTSPLSRSEFNYLRTLDPALRSTFSTINILKRTEDGQRNLDALRALNNFLKDKHTIQKFILPLFIHQKVSADLVRQLYTELAKYTTADIPPLQTNGNVTMTAWLSRIEPLLTRVLQLFDAHLTNIADLITPFGPGALLKITCRAATQDARVVLSVHVLSVRNQSDMGNMLFTSQLYDISDKHFLMALSDIKTKTLLPALNFTWKYATEPVPKFTDPDIARVLRVTDMQVLDTHPSRTAQTHMQQQLQQNSEAMWRLMQVKE